MDSIIELIRKAQDAVEPFSEETSVELENFMQEPIIDDTRDLFNQTIQNLEKNKAYLKPVKLETIPR